MVTLLALASAHASGGYDFNLPHVQWHVLETEHFFLHWPESTLPPDDAHWFTTEASAQRLAVIAEQQYPKVCSQFSYFPKEKTHILLYDQTQGWQGDGFAIAELDWTGFGMNWGPIFRERGRAEALSDTFTHEFSHVISLKAYLPYSEDTTGFQVGGLVEDEEWLKRWGANPKPSVNFDVATDAVMSAHAPFWWAEGGAEYWSHQAGENDWGTSRDAFLRMTVLEDRLPTEAEWTSRMHTEGMEGERGYNNGYAFSLWLRERFDKDVVTEMTHVSHDHFHWSWDGVVKQATGVDMPTLHAEWKAHLTEHYGAQRAKTEADGLVAGRELAMDQPLYEKGGEDWEKLSWNAKKEALDQEGEAWFQTGAISPDGQWFTWFEDSQYLQKIRPGEWGAITQDYTPDDQSAKDAKAWARSHPSGTVDGDWMRPDFSPDSTGLLVTGVEGDPSDTAEALGLTHDPGNRWPVLEVCDWKVKKADLDVTCKDVPNTVRATEGAFSPDGKTIAFARYGDGTQDLWTVDADGGNPTRLTNWGDGTQLNGLDWSPTGRFLVTSLYQDHDADLWLYELATDKWTPLTRSRSDEFDPIFDAQGRVWFASDRDGKFDVYTLDLNTREVKQQTNVLGAAYAPVPSAEGHLFYTGVTGHGFRNFAVNAKELADRPVVYDGLCPASGCTTPTYLAPTLPDVRASSVSPSPKNTLQPFNAWPSVRLSDKNLEFGAGAYLADYTEKHALSFDFSVGKDTYVGVDYYNDMFWPTIDIGYGRYSYKSAYSYQDDLDGLPETTGDSYTVDLKYEQVSDSGWFYVSRYLNDSLWLMVGADADRYSFRETGDGTRWAPYVLNAGVGVLAEWDTSGFNSDGWINPQGGRHITVALDRRYSALLDQDYAGAVIDDGELMDRYAFNRVQVDWSEFLAVTGRHTLQLDFTAGYIDRNVMGWDEFIAGGRHPYDWGSGTIGNNSQFAGYEGWSLYGETMLIANASYRVPVLRDLDLKTGPVYTESVYLQAFGTAGNVWSYRVEGPSHLEGYSVVPDDIGGSVRREIPFVDYAAKNSVAGRQNYVLTDVGLELRVRQMIWDDWDWDSFLKVAYGFQPTAGYGDVNADLIQSAVARDSKSELSTEFEPPTLRVYLGLGTGW